VVGDGPRDGLTDPPGSVRGELEATRVLELVDRSHQTRVAFLDQIQETQPAVSILLGDGDDQSQIPGGQAAFGGVVLFAILGGLLDPPPERGRTLEGDPHQIAEVLTQALQRAAVVRTAGFRLAYLAFEQFHPLVQFHEVVEQRLQAIGPQVQLFDQTHGSISPAHQRCPSGAPRGTRLTLADRDAKICAIPQQQLVERFHIRPQTLQSPFLLTDVGHRDLDRTV